MKLFFNAALTLLFVLTGLAQSPYEISWKKDGMILGTNFLVGITASATNKSLTSLSNEEINALSRNDVFWFDRSATYNYSEKLSTASDVLVGMTIAAPFTLFLDDAVREDWKIISTMYLETILFSMFLPSFGKGNIERIRPYVYNADTPLSRKTSIEAKRSFFSGHTTWAFSTSIFFATVYNDYYPESQWKPYIWGGALAAASSVGILRYASGAHFPTDVLVGAVVGSAIGYTVPLFHRKNENNMDVSFQTIDEQSKLTLYFLF